MKKQSRALQVFKRGILQENALLVLLLGCCPSLAVTTSLINGVGMGVAATFVLLCSNLVISLLRNLIPDKVRIPCYITIIASFVTILQFLLEAYVPALNDTLGIFIPLITVNCIILGRAEAFAGKNTPLISVIDGLGMGIGFTAALGLIGGLRELLGNATLVDQTIPHFGGAYTLQPMLLFILPPGGFIIYGLLLALAQQLSKKLYGDKPDSAIEDDAIPHCVIAGQGIGNCGGCVAQNLSQMQMAQEAEQQKLQNSKVEAAVEKADAVKLEDKKGAN